MNQRLQGTQHTFEQLINEDLNDESFVASNLSIHSSVL